VRQPAFAPDQDARGQIRHVVIRRDQQAPIRCNRSYCRRKPHLTQRSRAAHFQAGQKKSAAPAIRRAMWRQTRGFRRVSGTPPGNDAPASTTGKDLPRWAAQRAQIRPAGVLIGPEEPSPRWVRKGPRQNGVRGDL
jgi:hypothetical protein